MHCEKYEKTEKQIDENHKFRNMGEKWLDYKIKFVSDVDLHEDYGQVQTRFTLLKKLDQMWKKFRQYIKDLSYMFGTRFQEI